MAVLNPDHAELAEVGKALDDAGEVLWERQQGQGELLERAGAEDVGREARDDGLRPLGLVAEAELLGALGGEEARPVGERKVQGSQAAADEGDEVEGARMVGEDSGSGGGAPGLGEVTIA